MSEDRSLNWKRIVFHTLFIYGLGLVGGAIAGIQIASGALTEQEAMNEMEIWMNWSIFIGTLIISSVYRSKFQHFFCIWSLLTIVSIPNIYFYDSNLVSFVEAITMMAFLMFVGTLFGKLVNSFIIFLKKSFTKNE